MFNRGQGHFLSTFWANQAKNLALPFAFGERKNRLLFSKTGKLFKFANRQISQQKLSIDFKKPWFFLVPPFLFARLLNCPICGRGGYKKNQGVSTTI